MTSAKINLNKVWHKLVETSSTKKALIKKKLKTINQLNNQNNKSDDLKILREEKNVAKGRYSLFLDDSIYQGVNLNFTQEINNFEVYQNYLNESMRRKNFKSTWTAIEQLTDNYYDNFYISSEGSLV